MPLSADLQALRDTPQNFLRTHWVKPGSQYSMSQLPDQTNPAGKNRTDVFFGAKAQIDTMLRLSRLSDKVVYANLQHVTSDQYNLHLYHGTQLTDPQKATLLPVWYLPWWENHVTKTRILSDDQMPRGEVNPDLFFTSALSGCSVFVEGPANSPTIYHAGFDSNRDFTAHPKLNPDSVQHWQLVFQQLTSHAAPATAADKKQYLTPRAQSADLQVYMNALKSRHRGRLVIEELNSEGVVFGIRDTHTRNWSFHLQEAVTVQYREITIRQRRWRRDQEIVGNVQYQQRPMCMRQIFPGGGGAHSWNTARLVP
jgi:hypothetical protein